MFMVASSLLQGVKRSFELRSGLSDIGFDRLEAYAESVNCHTGGRVAGLVDC